jgi:alpha-tubulin suppressor-like RCC1 family protein
VGLDQGVTSIAVGKLSTCAIVAGSVRCWGRDLCEPPTGEVPAKFLTTPQQISGLPSGATAVAMGYTHACALVDGTVRCWGNNDYGKLGDGSTTTRTAPVEAKVSAKATALAAGGNRTCAVVDGDVWCWGASFLPYESGEIPASVPLPEKINGLPGKATALALGDDIACAIVDSAVWCWGTSLFGMLGRATGMDGPVAIVGLESDAVSVAVEYSHACAVRAGKVLCWGYGFNNKEGDPNELSDPAAPVAGIAGGATMIALGANSSCAVISGAAQCWGSDEQGQLGSDSIGSPPGVNEVKFPK